MMSDNLIDELGAKDAEIASLKKQRDAVAGGSSDALREAADEIERLQARVDALEGVRGAAKYLSAEVDNDWREGRPSIDSRQAMHDLDDALAATEQGDKLAG